MSGEYGPSEYLPAPDDPSVGFSVVAGGCLSRSVTPLIICSREASLSWTSLGSSADGSSPVAMCLNFGLVAPRTRLVGSKKSQS